MIVTVFSLEYDLFTQFWGKKKKKLFMTESCHRWENQIVTGKSFKQVEPSVCMCELLMPDLW